MKIDLCKLFGVEEGEEFKINSEYKANYKYRVHNNIFQYYSRDLEQWVRSHLDFNSVVNLEIIKLPKKKQFTDDELAIMRSLPKEYEWIARDKTTDIVRTFANKPKKSEYETWVSEGYCCFLSIFNNLFNSIKWEDEEPVYIDDYVERGVE